MLRVAIVVGLVALLAGDASPEPGPSAVGQGAAKFVGAAACAPCHEAETKLWRSSDHAHAMEPANAQTVRGDFADAKFTKDGVATTFSKRDGKYFVRTDGPDGKLHDYRVAYTFGVDPLQQYLVELPGGRLQALRIAWDTRPKSAGGQRWFALYPDEKIDHADVLHWTGPAQNWNYMCADCHSTNVQKNYDAAKDGFATTWSDLDVACEACHGPGSRHVRWAEEAKAGRRDPDPLHGLVFALGDSSGGTWERPGDAPIAARTKPIASHVEVETCARCHSRRAQLWSEVGYGEPLAQSYRASLLAPELYHPDGQIRDEVYEYGSFLQSRMYAAGVTCTDCHDPHSARLRADGNALCERCHSPVKYDDPKHHFHAPGSAAARCVSCHMSERLYMVIDGRRDHSFRVPRPDLSEKIGTPNACSVCHADKPASWAAAEIKKRHPDGRAGTWSYGEALGAGFAGRSDATSQLLRVSRDASLPPIVRASAVALLGRSLDPAGLAVLGEAARDPDPLVRRAAAEAVLSADGPERLALAAPLLHDPIRTVRLEALDAVLDVPPEHLTAEQRADLAKEIEEYRRVQAFNADRADARVNLAALEARLGNDAAARSALAAAIRMQPSYAPAYVNLADLDRRAGKEGDAEATLRAGVKAAPAVAELHESLGLSLVRQKRVPEALVELQKASELDPASTRNAYVYAVALHDSGEPARAIEVLTAAEKRDPASRDVLVALVQYTMQGGDRAAALQWARKLAAVSDEPGVRELVGRLERGS